MVWKSQQNLKTTLGSEESENDNTPIFHQWSFLSFPTYSVQCYFVPNINLSQSSLTFIIRRVIVYILAKTKELGALS